jgi:uncharacterized protein
MENNQENKNVVHTNRIIHFDITADDPVRAQKFYGEIFGWKFDKWNAPMEYWLVKTGDEKHPGIDGGLSKRGTGAESMNTIDVPSIEEYAKKIQSKGGQVIVPKMPIQGVGYFAKCKDTEGNTFGIIEMDQNAK